MLNITYEIRTGNCNVSCFLIRKYSSFHWLRILCYFLLRFPKIILLEKKSWNWFLKSTLITLSSINNVYLPKLLTKVMWNDTIFLSLYILRITCDIHFSFCYLSSRDLFFVKSYSTLSMFLSYQYMKCEEEWNFCNT